MSNRKPTIQEARALKRDRNRKTIDLCHTAVKNGHDAMAHNLAGTILMDRLDVDLLRARAAHGG